MPKGHYFIVIDNNLLSIAYSILINLETLFLAEMNLLLSCKEFYEEDEWHKGDIYTQPLIVTFLVNMQIFSFFSIYMGLCLYKLLSSSLKKSKVIRRRKHILAMQNEMLASNFLFRAK